ncbi:GTPase [Corynebacterium macclintockiae]|uniref:GTPase n=1 Tax=Corynebacterium macclintockiae TaxID=2913501 RepID=UPI003EBE8E8D
MNQEHQIQSASAHLSQRVSDLTLLLTQAVDALAGGSPDLAARAEQLRLMVTRPPRVAVVGRLKSGKSTLVNALTENLIAATGALECTMAVSMYHNGAPARAEIHSVDGQVARIPLNNGPLDSLPVPLNEVDYIDQFLPNRRLEELTLIDTPGTATLTVENEQRTRRILVDGQRDTRRASGWADCLVFLSDSAPREDEKRFLSQLGMTPLNTVGILSRADSFGSGAFGSIDPLQHARQHANSIQKKLVSTVQQTIPLSGLMAESALTGKVTGDVARQLAALADLDRDDLLDFLEADDPREVVAGFSATDRDDLLDVMGEYGVFAGRSIAAEGGAPALVKWMVETSGVSELVHLLTGDITYFAVLQRAARMLDVLDDLASNHPDMNHIRWVLSVTLAQPGMHFVLLYRSYRNTYASTPDSRLLQLLRTAVTAGHPADTVNLPRDTPIDQVRRAIEERIAELQQLSMSPLSAAEDEARERLLGSFQSALQATI